MRLAALALAAAMLPAQAQVRLPSLGESAAGDFDTATEKRTGEQIMREIRRDPAYLDDPVLLDYLQSLWKPLVAVALQSGDIEPDTERSFAWEAFLVDDRTVNAFALPGGYVGVHLGLIGITSSADELASVLAHELSHVTQRHIARSVAASSRNSMVGLAALILGILAASRSNNADVANAAIMGGQAVAVQGQLNFSRDMEREADRAGFGKLVAAGFSPAGMASMFEKLDNANRLNDNGAFPYLRSHPLTVERVAEARSRALVGGAATPPVPTLRHMLMQARARVLMDTNPLSLRRFDEQAAASASAPPKERVAALYGGALAAALQRNAAAAERLAGEAVAQAATLAPRDPGAERALRLLQAQVRLARGDAPAALQALDALPAGAADLAADRAGDRPALLLRGQALLDLQRRQGGALPALRQSTEALQTWVAERPNDAAAWSLLAASADAVGLQLRALRANAESRAALGDLTGAIDRLRAAQAAARGAAGQDFIEASVIDARLRDLQAQRRTLALEMRGGRPSRDDEPPPPSQPQ